MDKLTGWYRGDQKPVRVGVYVADFESCVGGPIGAWYAHWDGSAWGWMTPSPGEAIRDYREYPAHRHEFGKLAWRGLTKKPKAKP